MPLGLVVVDRVGDVGGDEGKIVDSTFRDAVHLDPLQVQECDHALVRRPSTRSDGKTCCRICSGVRSLRVVIHMNRKTGRTQEAGSVESASYRQRRIVSDGRAADVKVI